MGLGPPLCRVCYTKDGVRAGLYRPNDGPLEWCLRCKRITEKDDGYLGSFMLTGGDAMSYFPMQADYKPPPTLAEELAKEES